MIESDFKRVNDYTSVRIGLASPEDIRRWSFGEVKKPETINYRTYRAEKDGLFCERIFGPERDWECFCGKYKGMKHKGTICDRCGVLVTHSRVRRKRMGHINLAAPVVHIWFFKTVPSHLARLLGIKAVSLGRIIYYQDYVVIDPGDTPLREKQLLSEEDLRACREKYGDSFKADMGAEAVRALLKRLNLEELSAKLRAQIRKTSSRQRGKNLSARLEIVQDLLTSENKPEWLVLDCIPVIPPDLRPLVHLDSGNFATSDLNDLYRRIINRNNRLKKLMELNAPEIIIRNEKRMLQQSVDALFDNSRTRRPVLGSSNRPLKSLADMIKGKQGRFRENLLGKRVDYSARSVIAVGPELKLNQCGIPKRIALELFQPFIIRRLHELGYADTIKSAKKMLERQDPQVWDILEDVTRDHPVLLNRAPTLHRMSIQAFEPVLIEGNAIEIHPLVCRAFNADFDGDAMPVHLPLSFEAQIEARTLMMSTNNIFSPANGGPIVSPSQDIVLGCYYLTSEGPQGPGQGRIFGNLQEVFMAYDHKKVGLHDKIKVRIDPEKKILGPKGPVELENGLCETTPGRIIFNDILPEDMPFYNFPLDQKALDQIIIDCHRLLGREKTIELLDVMKEVGFKASTLAGLSISGDDLLVPKKKKEILEKTQAQVERVQNLYRKGVITDGERYNQVIEAWTHAREQVAEEMMEGLANDERQGQRYLNPIYLMVASGARGKVDQMRQMAGMRGLMVKPSGRIIETPIQANFREGLGVLEYFTSTHGARKGLADTALKTAESGYLTRKMADVAQNVVITEFDCGTLNGITKATVYKGDEVVVPLSKNITGRVARDTIVNLVTDEVIVKENELITAEAARKIEELGYEKVRVRSPLTCDSPLGVCSRCYGADLSTGQLGEEGLAVGIIAAQSIGEPGTQLTMRTFHIGGTADRVVEESEIKASEAGILKYENLNLAQVDKSEVIVLNRNGFLVLQDAKDRELKRFSVPTGASLLVKEGTKVSRGKVLARWDPHMVPILAEMEGFVRFEDVVRDRTMREEVDTTTGFVRKVIIEHRGDLHPQIAIEDKSGKISGLYPLPEKANIEVEEGNQVKSGMLLAKVPREISRSQDITGGLPRVTEIFEARRPKDPAVMSKISGVVELGEKRRGKRTVVVKDETSGLVEEHLIPPGKHLRVHRGDRVTAGEPLMDGPLVPQDILRIKGEEALQQYFLQEVQNVYRSQNVSINDKHIEIIVSQMMHKVRIDEPGDTSLLTGQVVDKFEFNRVNDEMKEKGEKPATATPMLMGITKASLQSNSFISAASFQETTKVLTEAALSGRIDHLLGLKENVILGRLIPAGTGFKAYYDARLRRTLGEEKLEAKEAAPAKEKMPA
ncbi:MAG: DNA-directed RNA polymerase subunit beta' [Planctomycetes bacterium DG_23]|nr:MAG: DNA-directed RNA polymerase subunit beta' [Planctomycetes bacterium DG_23]